MIYEEFEFEPRVEDDYKLNSKKSMFINHNIRIVLGLVIVFLIGGLQALSSVGGWSAWVTTIVPILLLIEHALSGNTGT